MIKWKCNQVQEGQGAYCDHSVTQSYIANNQISKKNPTILVILFIITLNSNGKRCNGAKLQNYILKWVLKLAGNSWSTFFYFWLKMICYGV